MQKLKTQKGITLIALIITIIVMLILVGVSVTVALNGGLFKTAKDAVEGTKAARDEELLMDADGYIAAVQNKIAVGTEVTIGETGENFYVIKDEGAKLVLVAKYNIKVDGENWIQDTSGSSNPCEFSAAGGFTANEDLNKNATVKADTTSAVYKASQYAENTIENGATGRLMTLEEVEALGGSREGNSTLTCNTNGNKFVNSPEEGVTLNYWLGSALDADNVCLVYGTGSRLGSDAFDFDYVFGLRPVIEISESEVTIVP